MSDPAARDSIHHHVTSTHAMRVRRRSQGEGPSREQARFLTMRDDRIVNAFASPPLRLHAAAQFVEHGVEDQGDLMSTFLV
jgi:hypothetical protein